MLDKVKNRYLVIGIIISTTMLVVLFVIRMSCSLLLDIDVKWLVVCSIPLVIAMVLGQFIKKFNGFGVEIEMAVSEPIKYNLSLDTVITSVSATPKGTLNMLKHSYLDITKINVLEFTFEKRNFYNSYAIEEYLNYFINVQYILLVKSKTKEFFGLIKLPTISKFLDETFFARLKDTIENIDTTENQIEIKRDFIFPNKSVIDTLKQIKEKGLDFIAVVSNDNHLVGIAEKSKLEESIALAVINSIDRQS